MAITFLPNINFFMCVLLMFMSVNTFAATRKKIVPNWVTNHNEVFSPSEYIAFRGNGKTSETAQNNAISEMSYYFQTGVNSIRQVNYTSMQTTENGRISIKEQQGVSNLTSITTNMNLAGVELTEVYYDKKGKTYYCVAYMNRNTAWTQYKPKIDHARNNFYGYYKKGTEDTDVFSRIRYLGYAISSVEEFMDVISFGQMISEAKVLQEYGSDMVVMAETRSKQSAEIINTKIFMQVNDEPGNDVATAISKVFSDVGFSITQDKSRATYVADAQISYNKAQDNNVIVMRPGIVITITGQSGTVYSFSANASRVVQYTENLAKVKSAASISTVVTEKMPDDLVAAMSGGSQQ